MKKYLITESQRDAILGIPGYMNLKNEVAAIKPVEPLTDEQIEECCTTEVNRNEINFCRAIEQRIIGETP